MMNLCKNCKHWSLSYKDGSEAWGNNLSGMGECNNEKIQDPEYPMVLSQDDAPDFGILTSPNFGCNLFENKQEHLKLSNE